MTHSDDDYMRIALELAAQGQGFVEPNPMVGCVIVRDGEIIGRGYHQRFGGPHAEVEAIRDCQSAIDGATAYVTLEPCCHQGKTPPCTAALIEANIKRVVVAAHDPFPRVDGGGLQQLRDAGIKVDTGVLEEESCRLLAPYLKRVCQQRPWVIAKWAMTIDGRIATSSGESQWITGEHSRANVHELRGRVDAIAVGMGTVEKDDPLLTARPSGARAATRVVFCRHRSPRVESKLIQTANQAPVLIIASPSCCIDSLSDVEGVESVVVEGSSQEMVLESLTLLAQRGVTNLMIEGGGELLGSFFSTNQIDECHVYLGAKAFGGSTAPGPIGGSGVLNVADAPTYSLVDIKRFEQDICAVYRKD